MKSTFPNSLYLFLTIFIGIIFLENLFSQQSSGDEFTFVRIKYTSGGRNYFLRNPFGTHWPSWAVDYPFAEENFLEGLEKATTINVAENAVALPFTDPEFFRYPFAYILEVGFINLSQPEADSLKEWLLRGGFLMVDDFHGPHEWQHFVQQMKMVFPDRPIVDIPKDHPLFHCYYDFNEVPQIPGLGSVFRGKTYEKGGVIPRCMGIFDDQGRLMVLVNRNTDIGDSWEHAKDPRYPPDYSIKGYKLGINFVIYALTH